MTKPQTVKAAFPRLVFPRVPFALFPVGGTRRLEVARGLVSECVVSLVMVINSSPIKGGGVARRRLCIRSLERYREICQATRSRNGSTGWNSIDHSPQVRTSSNSRFAKPHASQWVQFRFLARQNSYYKN
ncbi:hypothetical protein AVEN_163366-1 [Araneus ventricosus]|uniref:Uncharacterized protein n=1 Tax=Araneus ventricosus TaxID=182803 RepID=A0A4Y2N7U6_ARAVE|nr:hypothetical protein AVEN_163366-1 [Araneus ventricosus]